MWAAVAVVFLQLCGPETHGQVRVDTARGLVGKEVSLLFRYDGDQSLDSGSVIDIGGDFQLTHPTVFYPQVFRPGSKVSLIDSTLDSSTDSTWSFSLSLLLHDGVEKGDTLFLLSGEALAGTDSTTLLLFRNLTFAGETFPDMIGTIITESIGPRLPYVRFAVLDPGRPNPTTTGVKVTWGFRIDKESEVIFKIYDVLGQEVNVQDLGVLDKGVYINTFTPDITIPSGMFIVRLITNSGEATQVLHVVR